MPARTRDRGVADGYRGARDSLRTQFVITVRQCRQARMISCAGSSRKTSRGKQERPSVLVPGSSARSSSSNSRQIGVGTSRDSGPSSLLLQREHDSNAVTQPSRATRLTDAASVLWAPTGLAPCVREVHHALHLGRRRGSHTQQRWWCECGDASIERSR